MENKKETQKGLQLLDDDALVQIVENDLENHGELKSRQAYVAFAELERRTPRQSGC